MDKISKKKFLMLGFAIPDKEMQKSFEFDNLPQVQTHKFNWNIIKAMEYNNSFDITYISTRPVSDYPSYPQLRFKMTNWIVKLPNKEILIMEIPFINFSIAKLITRFIFALVYSIKSFAFKKNKGGVIVYSVHVPFMLLGFLISKFFRIEFIAIWTDPPATKSDYDSLFKSNLRTIENVISKFLMRRVTKIIAITKYLPQDYSPNKPFLVIEGIVDVNEINLVKKEQHGKKRIVYAGSISKRYGIINLVKGLLLTKRNDIVLEIYGRGDYETELKNIARLDNRIIYKGYVSNTKIIQIIQTADLLINTRSSDELYVKYSFPSKMLEYMMSGTPLLTTMLPGIPDEYRDYIIILNNNSPEEIAKGVDYAFSLSEQELEIIGNRARHFATSKDVTFQGEKIVRFIDQH